jgi:hypothetical protein
MAHNGRTGLSKLIHEWHCHGARPRSQCEEGTGKPEDRQCRAAGRVNRWPPALDSWSRVRPRALKGLPLLAHRKAGQQLGMAWRSFGWSDPSPLVVVHNVKSSPTLAVMGWWSARSSVPGTPAVCRRCRAGDCTTFDRSAELRTEVRGTSKDVHEASYNSLARLRVCGAQRERGTSQDVRGSAPESGSPRGVWGSTEVRRRKACGLRTESLARREACGA